MNGNKVILNLNDGDNLILHNVTDIEYGGIAIVFYSDILTKRRSYRMDNIQSMDIKVENGVSEHFCYEPKVMS